MTETTIYNFHTSFYIIEIHKLPFSVPNVQILGTNNCDDSHRNAFKRRESFQDVLCCRDYDDCVVASFAHKIQPEFYGGNRSVSIEGILLDHFNELPQTEINASKKSCPRHAVFNFFPDDRKQDSATTTAHVKYLIELLKNKNYWRHH